MKTNITLLAVIAALSFAAVPAYGQQVPIVGIDILRIGTDPAIPRMLNNRGDQNNAIDGDLNSLSFLTPGGTSTPQFVAFDIGTAMDINHLRVSKQSDLAAVGQPQDTADLQILFTTDSGPLVDRNYTPVSGLSSGFLGAELIDALSVNSADATVIGDNHDRVADSQFYSLSFDTASATGLAIRFEKGPSSSNPFTHYPLFEAQLLDGSAPKTILGIDVFSEAIPEVINPPNPRGDQGLAIDGDENTFSFLTPGETETPQLVVLELAELTTVHRLRVLKLSANTDATGGLIDNMDLQILYTTDTGPSGERTYLPVSGLTNGGLGGVEPILADSVNAVDATVDNDRHGNGWYTLSFDAVGATSLAFRFARDSGDAEPFTHYPVLEFQVEAIPEPSAAILMAVGLLSMSLGGRRRRERVSGK